MKKITYSILFLTLALFVCSSCEKDEDDEIIATTLNPKPNYTPFALRSTNKEKRFRFYKKKVQKSSIMSDEVRAEEIEQIKAKHEIYVLCKEFEDLNADDEIYISNCKYQKDERMTKKYYLSSKSKKFLYIKSKKESDNVRELNINCPFKKYQFYQK